MKYCTSLLMFCFPSTPWEPLGSSTGDKSWQVRLPKAAHVPSLGPQHHPGGTVAFSGKNQPA